MQATAASRGEQSRQACRGAACCRHSLRVTATVGQETLKSIGLLLRMVHRPGLAIGPAELPRSPRRTLWRRSSWFSRQIHRVGLTHVVSSLPVVRIFTLVGRHVTRTAAGTVVVAFSAPHIRPLIRTAFTAVELSKEHIPPGKLFSSEQLLVLKMVWPALLVHAAFIIAILKVLS